MTQASQAEWAQATTRRTLGGLARGVSLVALVATLAACGAGAPARDRAVAPDFALATFDGRTVGLAELRGQAVVLNFWASWCGPCRAELPVLEAASGAYRERGVAFLGVAVQDEPEPARAFAREAGISYPVGLDAGNAIALRYGLVGLPTTVFIARDGTITRTWRGPLTEGQLGALLDELAR